MNSDSLKKFALRWGPALLMMGLIFFFSSIPMKPQPELDWLTLVKKGGHLLGYALLALAVNRATLRADPASWPASPPTSSEVGSERGLRLKGWKRMAAVFGIVMLFALSDEFHQSFVPGRNPSLIDVGIDLLGAVLGLVTVNAFIKVLNSVATSGKT
jgi:VanZ family protein